MSYNKINNITGWAVGIFACLVYLMTMEGTISFWDCGEFAAGAVKLEVVHSPGAPLFLLIGRFFAIIFGNGNEHLAINSVSALSSGFTILFLFWTITHFARRIALQHSQDETLSANAIAAIMGAGVIGALAYTFSDTFWFSAVEAEVYAMSSLLTALVFWAILKWEDRVSAGSKIADRWIIFIAFVIGLSVGVHLLNLLTIPAIVMVYYFKKFKFSPMGTLIAFLIGCAITGIVQIGVIQYVPKIMAWFDVKFVNSLGLPFNSGVYFVLALLAALSVFLLMYAKRNGKYYLHLGTLAFIFILIGYSSYFQTVIRSNADVPIDMTNPDNAFALVDYLGRAQYGSIPHLTGPDYTSRPINVKEGSMQYWKGKDKYEELGPKRDEYIYPEGSTRVFPRIWDGNSESHVAFYQNYLGLNNGEEPSAADNLKFFMGYQVNQMWWRYFCWNYIGRQNDFQNIIGEPQNSNWLSGIKFIDNNLFGRGDIDKAPDIYSKSKARNEFYFLPFILGILGILYQIKHDKKNAFVVGLLFFFTGLAIVIYLNNTPMQPRERDYAYAGATYAFAIWIGLGLLMVRDWVSTVLKGSMATYLAIVACLLAVPVMMAAKGWDDHDRSQKTLARDTATNYLQSLDKNAILFTEGDNDTYPLWFAQEVKGVRPDVRIINLSLLGIDWYIDQLNWAVNEAGAIPMVWKPEDYRGNNLNQAQYQASPKVDANAYYDLKEVMQYLTQNKSRMGAAVLPIKNFSIPINKDNIKASGILSGRDSILNNTEERVSFTLPRDYALKNDLALLNILAANDWKRPIYFANSIDQNHYEGLGEYLELEGLVFKLVPYRTPGSSTITPLAFNVKRCLDWVMNDLKFGNAQLGTVYYNQTNRRMLNGIRVACFQIADNFIRNGKKAEAIKVMDHLMKNIHEKSYPLAITQEDKALILIADTYMKAGAKEQAEKLMDQIIDYSNKQVDYFNTLREADKAPGTNAFSQTDFCRTVLGFLAQSAVINEMKPIADKLQKALADITTRLPAAPQQFAPPQ